MRKIGIIAVLSLLVTALAAVPALAATFTPTFNTANAPTGTHLQTGTIQCVTNPADSLVTCSTYELAGIGNLDAQVRLTANYTATVTCTNKGGELVEVKTQTRSTLVASANVESKNGRVLIPTLNSGPIPSDATFKNLATCPNRNWTKAVVAGSKQIQSFTYTVTFGTIGPNNTFVAAFPGPYLTITGT
jgi:hypothetical protein